MVNQALEDIYKKLSERKRKYDTAARLSNTISNLGSVVFYSSFIIPTLFLIFFGDKISLFYIQIAMFGGLIFGIVILAISARLRRKIPQYLILSSSEIEFFKVFEALKELDMFLKTNDSSEFARFEAAELISNIERDLNPSKSGSKRASLRRALTKEIYDKLESLRRNLNEKLIPTMRDGKAEEINKAYPIVEELAQYLLKPSFSELDNLNVRMSELQPPNIVTDNIVIKEPFILLLRQNPYFRHIFVFLIIFLITYISFYLGTNYFDVPRKDAYTTALLFGGTLSAGYFVIIAASIAKK